MRISTIAAASLVALTALPAAAQAQADYRAAGTEPFWSLTIGARTMRFEAPGRAPVSVPTPRVIHGFAGEIWQTRRINVNTNHVRCTDGMSDRSYPDTVTVTIDGRTYKGCGGEPRALPGAGPIEGSWRIEALNGRPVVRGTNPTVSFENGRISGNAGCNRFNGSYDFARGRLNAGPLASTRMACLDRARSLQETAILNLLGERLTVSSNRQGKLVLSGARGRTLTLVRSRP
ncbi:META domain-containing protein [Sphingomonas sp. HITSZ_GF]|uniref:META domain-containing protein n=1 Tax=Sphingomonas sp. HITSZ_GF TaxID=3037247 RepID=UPI00240DC99F|nr:META domain-containing protein [Sphingomonas sp. HITSZ_GF]MDG2532694.1 META domain-containing protein [Sphingomonas sp. HITSZ_GF]